MNIHFKNTFRIIKDASKEWMLKDPFRGSAVIAYYAIFSLPGLLIVIIAVMQTPALVMELRALLF